MTLTDGIKCPAADAAVVWCNHCQPRKRGVYQRGRLQRTPAPSHILVAATPSIVRIAFGGTAVAIARVIEGGQRHCDSEAYATPSDLSPSSTLSGGVEADLNARNCAENASNPLVVSGHAERMTHTSLKTAIAGVAPRPLNFPRGPLETCTLHDQRLLVSPTGRCGNADHILTGQRSYTDERERPSKRFGLMQGSRRVTSRSGGGYGLWPATALQQTSPHYRRNLQPVR
jgi:hypothetical protein